MPLFVIWLLIRLSPGLVVRMVLFGVTRMFPRCASGPTMYRGGTLYILAGLMEQWHPVLSGVLLMVTLEWLTVQIEPAIPFQVSLLVGCML